MRRFEVDGRHPGAFALVLLGAAAACSAPPGSSPSSAPSIAAAVPPRTAATLLPRSVHPFARPERDEGRLDPATPMLAASLVLGPSELQRGARDARLAAVDSPASPLYHQWLTPEQYAASFGASPAEVAKSSAWLEAQGFTPLGTSRTGGQLFFSGTAGQVEQAFQTEMHRYFVGGEHHFAMAKVPSIPAELSDRVLGLHGLHDFRPRSTARAALRSSRSPAPAINLGSNTYLAPSDFATMYDVTALYTAGIDGTNAKIAVAGQSSILGSDITSFRTLVGLPTTSPAPVSLLVPGSGDSAQTVELLQSESDVEWAGGVAQKATVEYVFTGNNPAYNVNDALAYVVNQGLEIAPVVSDSYATCELGLSGADADFIGEVASAANLMGLTIVASAGQTGAEGCYGQDADAQNPNGISGLYVSMPASLPGVTGVGGTEFPASTLVPPYWVDHDAVLYPTASDGTSLETVWNDTVEDKMPSAGGGGLSAIFAKPFYQVGITPADGARDVPDISVTASDDNASYVVFDTPDGDDPSSVGGTTATPALAGIVTLLNESVSVSTADGGVIGLGNINPILYALATSSPSAFHDIVSGNNDVPCSGGVPGCPSGGGVYGYDAGPGYDLATGIGTIDAKNLVAAWSSIPTSTSLAVSATSVDVGAPITLTATVTSSGTTGSMSGDTVSFTFETYAAAGNSDGGFDESWVLATSTVTATSTGGKQGATAAYTTAIPAGFNGKADVVAMFNGDPRYLASRSAKTRITLANLTFAAVPPSAICEPSGTVQFSTTGGTLPVRWYVLSDSTYSTAPGTGYTTAATVTNAGLYTAGPNSGSSVLVVMDSAGDDAFVTVTVEELADAGIDAGEDSGTDAGTADASTDSGALADAGSDASVDSGSEDAGSADAESADAESDATVDGGNEAGGADAASDAGVDSGSEAGIADAEADVTSPVEAGGDSGAPDSGPSEDSGETADAASPTSDAGAEVEEGGVAPGSSVEGGGCGCVVAGGEQTRSNAAAFAGVLLGLVAMGRRRRSRKLEA
jgi:MYXO-CTERM domain-containing protein